MEHEGFHKKGFLSLWVFFNFVVLVCTGVVLYMAPAQRVASWMDWHFLWLTKTQWSNIHTVIALAFTVTGLYHLVLNWKEFASYVAGWAEGVMAKRFELALAGMLTVMLVIGAVFSVPPVGYVKQFGQYLQSNWVGGPDYEPPLVHAEQMSLKVFTDKLDIPLDKAYKELATRGVRFLGVYESLSDIARANRKSPMDLYMMIQKYEPLKDVTQTVYTAELVDEKFGGVGLGRRSLPWVVQDLGLSPMSVKARLAARGMRISDDETLKQAADRYNIEPLDIMKIILVEGYKPHHRK